MSLNDTVSIWLKNLDLGLKAGDVAAVTALFNDDCYWRDLVSFTWNHKTLEGKPAIVDMLKHTLKNVRPSDRKRDGEATGTEGL